MTKRAIAVILAITLLIGLNACRPSEPTNADLSTESMKSTNVRTNDTLFHAQYIRTNEGNVEWSREPQAIVLHSVEELNSYCRENKITYHTEDDWENQIEFSLACSAYNEEYFKSNYLVLVLINEGSVSVSHRIQNVEQSTENKLEILIDRIDPGELLDVEGNWHIILELSRDFEVATNDDVLIYMRDVDSTDAQ